MMEAPAQYPSLLMEASAHGDDFSFGSEAGIFEISQMSPDMVVCTGSPEMQSSFDDDDDDNGLPSSAGFCEVAYKGESDDCLNACSPKLDCPTVGDAHSVNGLTQAMFPEVDLLPADDGVDRWSEILLNTPIKAEPREAAGSNPGRMELGDPQRTEDCPCPVDASHGIRVPEIGIAAGVEATEPGIPNANICSLDAFLPDGGDRDGSDGEIDFEDPEDSSLCHPGLRLVTRNDIVELPKEEAVLCINAGGQQLFGACLGMDFQEDAWYVGGDVLRTEEIIVGEEGPSVYQSARFGNFSYTISDLPAGDYFVDLHFAEIVFTNGPPGMRVFDVFIQGTKILSELDIYSRVGSNTPLILMDARVNLIVGGTLTVKFNAIIGSPTVSAICIRKAPPLDPKEKMHPIAIEAGDLKEADRLQQHPLNNEDFNQKNRSKGPKGLLEYKRKLEEVTRDYELKKKECHEAWMSLQDSNDQLEKLRSELMRKSLHVGSLAHAVEGQVNELRDLQDQHDMEKRLWISAVQDLNVKIRALKSDYVKLSDDAYKCAVSLPDINSMTSAVKAVVDQTEELKKECAELKSKFIEESKERKQLYNKVLELKGNIRVFCRCRPLNAEEVAAGASSVAEFDAAKDCELSIRVNGGQKKVFKFDSVFTPQNNQVDVFSDTAPVVISVLDGYNVCIFAYGQTGTGKTFTMEGTEENRGVNFRTLEELFRIAAERKGQFNYDISVSVLEVYNEQIRDLLASSSQAGQTVKKLEIKQVAEGVHHVPGLVEAQVHSMNEVWDVLQTGSSARAVGSTNANEHSSRSHCILCVMVKGENLINGECTRSKLWLVDLAGSERVAKTDVQGERLKEAQNINKSLSALGDVISALATKSSHIPFRNSKLTHLLQDSLGGDSKTLMFVQISPNENDISETLCSLNFASRVRGIELGPARKQLDSSELLKYKQMVEKAKQDGRLKDGSMKKMEDTIQTLETRLKGREQAYKSLQDKVKELEGQLANEKKVRSHLEIKLKEQQQVEKLCEKLPLTRHFGALRSVNETSALTKDLVNLPEPLTENRQRSASENNGKPQDSGSLIKIGLMDPYPKGHIQKENKSDQPLNPVPRRTGRASICTTARRTSIIPAARRISMVPLPVTRNEDEEGKIEDEVEKTKVSGGMDSVTANTNQELGVPITSTPVSLRGLRTSNTLNRLRRSIHKKVHFNSPLLKGPEVLKELSKKGENHIDDPTAAAPITSGGQKLPPLDTGRLRRFSSTRAWGRLSVSGNIGAQRVLCANKAGTKSTLQQREKERGWNR